MIEIPVCCWQGTCHFWKSRLPSGRYLSNVISDRFVEAKKILLLFSNEKMPLAILEVKMNIKFGCDVEISLKKKRVNKWSLIVSLVEILDCADKMPGYFFLECTQQADLKQSGIGLFTRDSVRKAVCFSGSLQASVYCKIRPGLEVAKVFGF